MGLIDKKVGEFSVGKAFAIGVSKAITEAVLKPIVGNGNPISGGLKLAGAYFLPKWKWLNKTIGENTTEIIATGMAVDGVEDVVYGVTRGASQGTSNGMII